MCSEYIIFINEVILLADTNKQFMISLIAIVGIVAISGLIFMYMGGSRTGYAPSAAGDMAGQFGMALYPSPSFNTMPLGTFGPAPSDALVTTTIGVSGDTLATIGITQGFPELPENEFTQTELDKVVDTCNNIGNTVGAFDGNIIPNQNIYTFIAQLGAADSGRVGGTAPPAECKTHKGTPGRYVLGFCCASYCTTVHCVAALAHIWDFDYCR